jgi:hypothetical protein
LIGDDAIVHHDGIEIIACGGSNGYPPHVVYPHFGDPPDAALTSHNVYPSFGVDLPHVVYPHFGDPPDAAVTAHNVYPSFCAGSGGLIGETRSVSTAPCPGVQINAEKSINGEASVVARDSGVELITIDPGNGHLPHAVYPDFGDRPDAAYSFFGVNIDAAKEKNKVEK